MFHWHSHLTCYYSRSLDLWKNCHVKANKGGLHPVLASLHVWLSIFFFTGLRTLLAPYYWIYLQIFSSFVWVITIGKEFDYYKFSI